MARKAVTAPAPQPVPPAPQAAPAPQPVPPAAPAPVQFGPAFAPKRAAMPPMAFACTGNFAGVRQGRAGKPGLAQLVCAAFGPGATLAQVAATLAACPTFTAAVTSAKLAANPQHFVAKHAKRGLAGGALVPLPGGVQ